MSGLLATLPAPPVGSAWFYGWIHSPPGGDTLQLGRNTLGTFRYLIVPPMWSNKYGESTWNPVALPANKDDDVTFVGDTTYAALALVNSDYDKARVQSEVEKRGWTLALSSDGNGKSSPRIWRSGDPIPAWDPIVTAPAKAPAVDAYAQWVPWAVGGALAAVATAGWIGYRRGWFRALKAAL